MKQILLMGSITISAVFFPVSSHAQVNEVFDVYAEIASPTSGFILEAREVDYGILRIPSAPLARCIYAPFGFAYDGFTGQVASPDIGCGRVQYNGAPDMRLSNCNSGQIQVTISVPNNANSSGAIVTLLTETTAPVAFTQSSTETYTCDGTDIVLQNQAYPAVIVESSNTPSSNEVIGQVAIDVSF